jgi:predicted RNase H-like nuclease
MVLAGVDLAWQSEKNPSAIAQGFLDGNTLNLVFVDHAVYGIESVIDTLNNIADLRGIAIDAPLIIKNNSGHRAAEKQIGTVYGSRGASCHACNTRLYPDASSVYLAQQLQAKGFAQLSGEHWQFECYPHASIIEIFGLAKRLQYKKGLVGERRSGQARLAAMLKTLVFSDKLSLRITDEAKNFFDEARIMSLAGRALKSNENALDAIVCLYVAGLNALGCNGRVFGDTETGCVWIPAGMCIDPHR